ncbi:MAG TPA: FAD-dependent oxidoreductase [Novimethylophilus sp.]|jgi:glycine oxidase|uniref:NAD(P)/FAD-dependent oxidoreductase n=1 Tax=Novimethylophilus sp. TaxID=2137426 RepID=UPI002F3F7D28
MSDIVIIGAGVVGCMTAMELAVRGANVMLVDRADAGGEASWAGGGILFPLLPWRYREEVNRLALAGAAGYPALAAELHAATGIDPEYSVSGMLVHPPCDMAVAQSWCAAHDMTAELQEDKLWLPQVAQVRNPRLTQALRRWLQEHGVRLLEHTEVSGLKIAGNRVAAVQAGAEMLAADDVVVTAGAWSRPLLGEHAAALDFKPMRGQMLLYEMPAGLLQHIHYQDDFYLIPRRDGHILAGSTVEDVGFDKSTTATAARELHQKAVALLPQLHGRQPVRHWSGLRPGSPDNIPAIGRHPVLKNLWLNTGHFRYGVTMAPASSRLIASLLAGKAPFMDASPYAFGG